LDFYQSLFLLYTEFWTDLRVGAVSGNERFARYGNYYKKL